MPEPKRQMGLANCECRNRTPGEPSLSSGRRNLKAATGSSTSQRLKARLLKHAQPCASTSFTCTATGSGITVTVTGTQCQVRVRSVPMVPTMIMVPSSPAT